MKTTTVITFLTIAVFNFIGCYTQLATNNDTITTPEYNDDSSFIEEDTSSQSSTVINNYYFNDDWYRTSRFRTSFYFYHPSFHLWVDDWYSPWYDAYWSPRAHYQWYYTVLYPIPYWYPVYSYYHQYPYYYHHHPHYYNYGYHYSELMRRRTVGNVRGTGEIRSRSINNSGINSPVTVPSTVRERSNKYPSSLEKTNNPSLRQRTESDSSPSVQKGKATRTRKTNEVVPSQKKSIKRERSQPPSQKYQPSQNLTPSEKNGSGRTRSGSEVSTGRRRNK